MRSMWAGAALVALTASGVSAQQQMGPGASYPAPGMQPGMQMHMPPSGAPMRGGSRWGSRVNGHWSGGVNAPGGWAAYRAPYRGYRVPSYWVTPRFYVTDWNRYGFAAPAQGQYWTRYYDDAVLIDGRGEVYDVVGAVDWDRYDSGYAGGYQGSGYARRSSGLGGAAVGAAVGGVAGNLIGGRGNRLAGTLVGAGVGAAAGYAVDRAADARRGPPPAPYGADYGQPPLAGDYPPPPPGDYGRYHDRVERRVYTDGRAGGSRWVSPDSATTVVTTTGGGYPAPYPPAYGYGTGYGYSAGYTYGGGSVTTVTVQSAPVVTTTTTEVIEDSVSYARRSVARRVYRPRRVWHPRPRPRPRPTCLCGS